MVRFALKTLLADRGKLLTALVGVIFSLVLVNVQGGLFLGLIQKASLLVDRCDADIWIGHRGIENADLPGEIPEIWLHRIRGLTGVERAEPYIVGTGPMYFPTGSGFQGVWVVGSERTSMLGSGWNFSAGSRADLRRPDSVTVDELDDWKLGHPKVGEVREINGKKARIVAKTKGVLGFLTTPYVFTTIDNARTYVNLREGYCSYFLVKVRKGTDLEDLCRKIRARVPEVDVYTKDAFSRKSRHYWIARTGIGVSFGMSTVFGLMVGLVMVAQSLYALALDHLGDYATLKAIGAEDRHVYVVLALQAVSIALVGSVVGVVLVVAIQALASTPFAPILIPPWLTLLGVGLVFGICLFACLLPFGRIRGIDPATVLQR